MNTKMIYKTGLALASLLVVFSSCEKQLEISPRQSIEASTALSSKDAIDATITSIYATYKSARLYGRDLIAIPEVLADNGFATNKSGRLLNEANNVIGAHFTGSIWSGAYAAINQINNSIDQSMLEIFLRNLFKQIWTAGWDNCYSYVVFIILT